MPRTAPPSSTLLVLAVLAAAVAAAAEAGAAPVAGAPRPDARHVISVQQTTLCPYVYGIESDTGHLYRVDLPPVIGARRPPELLRASGEELDLTAPDGLAHDPRFRRLYFADVGADGVTRLYLYDLSGDMLAHAGDLQGTVAGAVFHDGGYYYVDEGTDDLRRVFLDDDGTVFAESSVTAFGFEGGLRIEDLAVLDGIMFGSTRSEGDGPSARFFTYDLNRDEFRTVSTSSGTFLQLAFVEERQRTALMGASAHDGVFYEIGHLPWDAGETTLRFTEGDVLFADLAPAGPC